MCGAATPVDSSFLRRRDTRISMPEFEISASCLPKISNNCQRSRVCPGALAQTTAAQHRAKQRRSKHTGSRQRLPRVDDGDAERLERRNVARSDDEAARARNGSDVAVC